MEGRGCRSAELPEGKMAEMSRSDNISTKQGQIADLAREDPERQLSSLAKHIDLDWLKEAYRRTRKDGAPGVDGRTAADYAVNLEENLRDLLDRAKSGRYFAPSVRRVNIPKGKGKETRPIGIPTFEDKVLQRAVVMVLEIVYEQDFLDCSYGFRPGRSPHQALQALWDQSMEIRGGWVLEVDIRKCFDTLDHEILRDILRKRVTDGVLVRLIGKWLNAGVLEEGVRIAPKAGVPQGGVISPLLMNIYLHEIFDRWFEYTVKPRLRGRGFAVRYADDLVMGFSLEEDARRVQAVISKRFGKYGLSLHPEKTRLIRFNRPPFRGNPRRRGRGKRPGTFDFLGFTHYWGRSRHGNWVIKRKTARDRFSRSLRRLAEWCRRHRHDKPGDQHRGLVLKLKGHYGYYGITGNGRMLTRFFHEATRIWKKWLGRRSRKSYRHWNWFHRLQEAYPLPRPRVVHSIYV